MNVDKILLNNFTTHDRTVLKLPKTGIVLITGENGAGKSSFVEGVAWAGWGKTLRGDVPWRLDAKEQPCGAQLMVSDPGMFLTRERKGNKSTLTWENTDDDAEDAQTYDTPSKAQEALVEIIGTFDLWRRSHVFSSADAAHFTLASDGERKRLIESFLGADKFDEALKRCREDLKAANERANALQSKQSVAAAKLEAARKRLTETKKQLAACQPPPPFTPTVVGESAAEIDATLQQIKAQVAHAREELRVADRSGGEWDAAARNTLALLDKLRGAKCPTCTQDIAPELRDKLANEAKEAKGHAEDARKRASTGRAAAEEILKKLDVEVANLVKKRDMRVREQAAEQAHVNERERTLRTRGLLEQTLRAADEEVALLTPALVLLEEQIEVASSDVDELTAAEMVLGLKGFRAHVLSKSLRGIEVVANAWLARLHPKHMRLSLRPYSELKNGKVEDEIALEIESVGRGSYKSTSGGERRRADVALLLGLGEVAAAARGKRVGTLWFDEVFDCLDEQGVDAVVSALRDLAKERAVVIITHSRPLIARLPDAKRVHVADGRIDTVG